MSYSKPQDDGNTSTTAPSNETCRDQENRQNVPNDAYQLSEENWLCLSFLTGIGPSRLSRLYTYLQSLSATSSDEGQIPVEKTTDLVGDASDETQQPTPVIHYDLLRALKWPEVTAREAIDYLQQGLLNEEQAHKRDVTLAWLAEADHHVVFQHHPAYPQLLKEITVAPTFLYLEGQLDCLSLPKIGIVGARLCTGYGRDATRQLAEQLSDHGVCVVSGGARGIDTAAHQGALNGNSKPTIAVMGTGLLNRYPKQNKALFESILHNGGALISEYPLMTEVRAHLFPPRNRIISGLSSGVLVAEASLKSGSLISASYAVQQNRDVFALPGRVSDPQAEGCHHLIRQGAILVRQVDDILNECVSTLENHNVSHETLSRPAADNPTLADEQSDKSQVIRPIPKQDKQKAKSSSHTVKPAIKSTITPLPDHLSIWAQDVAKALEKETQALDFDALIRLTELSAQNMMQALMELELSTCIVNYNGRYERC